jgi:hypothetical protein
VQGDRRLTRTRDALQDQHPGRFVADDRVLFPLDGRHDVLHLVIGGLAQLPLQDVIADVQRALEQVFQAAVLDLVLAFAGDLAVDGAPGCFEGRRSGLEVVVEAGDGGTPVMHHDLLGPGIGEVVHPDVVRLGRRAVAGVEVDAPEIRGIEQPLDSPACLNRMFGHSDRGVHLDADVRLLDAVHVTPVRPHVFLVSANGVGGAVDGRGELLQVHRQKAHGLSQVPAFLFLVWYLRCCHETVFRFDCDTQTTLTLGSSFGTPGVGLRRGVDQVCVAVPARLRSRSARCPVRAAMNASATASWVRSVSRRCWTWSRWARSPMSNRAYSCAAGLVGSASRSMMASRPSI